MRTVRVSDQAKADMVEIWDYIARDSVRAADRMVQSIVNAYLRLITSPGQGRARAELRPSMRSIPVRNYLIFYRFDDEYVYVVRVLHGARNLRRLFKQETAETYTEEDAG